MLKNCWAAAAFGELLPGRRGYQQQLTPTTSDESGRESNPYPPRSSIESKNVGAKNFLLPLFLFLRAS